MIHKNFIYINKSLIKMKFFIYMMNNNIYEYRIKCMTITITILLIVFIAQSDLFVRIISDWFLIIINILLKLFIIRYIFYNKSYSNLMKLRKNKYESKYNRKIKLIFTIILLLSIDYYMNNIKNTYYFFRLIIPYFLSLKYKFNGKKYLIVLVLLLSIVQCSALEHQRIYNRTMVIDNSYENMCSNFSIKLNHKFENICRHNLGYSRKDMPQFDNITDFLNMKKYLSLNGISSYKNIINIEDFHITQAEIIRSKVMNFQSKYLYTDIVASKDLWVIDGHHRFVANILYGNKHISAIIFDEEIHKLMPLMLQFKYIKTDI